MKLNRKITALLYVCLIPFLVSLLLACYQWLNWAAVTGHPIPFARINSYIYAHSYGALLLVLFAGIQIGVSMSKNHARTFIFFWLFLAVCTWLSFKSFADREGLLMLMIAYISAWLYEFHTAKNNLFPAWYGTFKNTINPIILLLLLILVLING